MQVWHVTIATVDRMPLFRDARAVRRAVRQLATLERRQSVAYSIADDHCHDDIVGERELAARVAGSIAHALGPLTDAQLAPARLRPIEGRAHLERSVPYILRQTDHHGLDEHAALWSGSCFADLVGARDIPGLRLELRTLLPRWPMSRIWAAVGLPGGGVAPATDEQLHAAGAVRIASAAAAAACADPELRGHGRPECEARWAAAQLARAVGIPGREVAWALGITTRGVRRACQATVRPTLLHATRLRLAIEDVVARQQRAA